LAAGAAWYNRTKKAQLRLSEKPVFAAVFAGSTAGKVPMSVRMLCSTICLLLFFSLSVFALETSPAALKASAAGKTAGSHGPYYVEISISRNLLTLFERKDGSAPEVVAQYPVGTVVRGLKTYPVGPGKVTAIAFDPWWYPTAYSRQVFRERGIDLPPKVPPGDPLNYMGAVKISLSHRTWKGAIYRIHGNNNPKRVGRRVTGGCFVMNNEEGVALAHKIKVGTEVNIVP
jgi:L,D-transpeptidase YnhG